MLQLENIIKDYKSGDSVVHALKGITLGFRKNEFVSILGPSGCGKTTMLNIIGGLDSYTSGNLLINGVETKNYKARDWDSYRNHSVGFVFQSYNLIPHQSVLSNVELALTLSGVSKAERKRRATEALEKVGLKEHINKKPNQLSGGQMQRVAIARALVNDPEILLADEPTGALDTETSIQVMEILKEISKDRLIIMVTHNPELAAKYSSRIIKLLDGVVVDDSNPFTNISTVNDSEDAAAKANATGGATAKANEAQAVATEAIDKKCINSKNKKAKKKKKTSMSLFTALSLSLNNLMTKKTRTILTSLAGSIGIIGIALILAISNGIQLYIDKVQQDTMSSYPIQLQSESVDISQMLSIMNSSMKESDITPEEGKIYTNPVMTDMINTMVSKSKNNNLKAFKKYLESEESGDISFISDIMYRYRVSINIYASETANGVIQVNPSKVMETVTGGESTKGTGAENASMFINSNVFNQLINNEEVLKQQYDIIAGDWPSNYNEVVLVTDKSRRVDDYTLYSLNIKPQSEVSTMFKDIVNGKIHDADNKVYSCDEILNTTFKLVLPTDYYEHNEKANIWVNKTDDKAYMKKIVDNGEDIKIVGILTPKEDASMTSISSGIGYTRELTEFVIDKVKESDIAKQQLANKEKDVFTGIDFDRSEDAEITMDDINAYIATLSEDEQKRMNAYVSSMPEGQVIEMFKEQLKAQTTNATYDSNCSLLGIADIDSPSGIDLYAINFENKDKIKNLINDYNNKVKDEGKDDNVLSYTDIVGTMISSISTIVGAISAVLIAFVAISLVVSSIMIGIITYISVLERTKEIGILRSIGASKRDISHVFNAETIIEGFVSGCLGIVITLILCIPANIIIENITDIANVAKLPATASVILIAISILLTLIAGLIPSRMAAKKDPVIALRSE